MIPLDQGAFITTFTGGRFHFAHPTPAEVHIEDIAHALSMICRFTGHTIRHYSVAQHAWHASHLVEPPDALEALLHDAAEAYVNDLSRPLKHHPRMDAYLEIEHDIEVAIRIHFGLSVPTAPPWISPAIKVVDNRLVVTEARQLLRNQTWTDGHVGYDFVLPTWTPEDAERRFLWRYADLTSGR